MRIYMYLYMYICSTHLLCGICAAVHALLHHGEAEGRDQRAGEPLHADGFLGGQAQPTMLGKLGNNILY